MTPDIDCYRVGADPSFGVWGPGNGKSNGPVENRVGIGVSRDGFRV